MYAKYYLEKIELRRIADIVLIQRKRDVTGRMRKTAHEICGGKIPTKEARATLAYLLYHDSRYIATMDRFVDTCLSIRDNGYAVRRINVPDSHWDFDTERLGRPSDALLYPTITLDVDGTIRGGNHRAAVLSALSIEFTPTLIVTQELTDNQADKEEADVLYMSQYDRAIEEYLTSEEWQSYTRTPCWSRSFGRVNNE
jgi:hypothetical protein